MKRERVAWLLSFLLLAVVAFRSPSSAQRDGDYLFVKTLVDIERLVANNYVEKVDENKLEQAAIDGMLTTLDPFTNFVPPDKLKDFDRMLEGTFKGVGIQLNQEKPGGPIEVVTPIDASPAAKAGVQAGDIILKVNGQSLEGMQLRDAMKIIAGEENTEVSLTVKHESGETVDLRMKRQEVVMPTVKGYQRKADNSWDWFVADNPKVAYVRITQFTPATYDTLKPILEDLLKQGMKGLILDLRWNPGGQLDQAEQVVDLFVEDGVIVSTKGEKRPEDVKRAHKEGTLPWFPMIVLVNEHSASAAEIVAGSLMDNRRAAVLGERTYGKGSVQEVIPLDGNSGKLKLTVAYYYLPSGRLVHKKKGAETWGVEPQIGVQMSEEQEQRVFDDLANAERFRRTTTKPTTQKTTPTTQPTDPQLQRAIDTLILMTVLQHGPERQTAEDGRGVAPATKPVAGRDR